MNKKEQNIYQRNAKRNKDFKNVTKGHMQIGRGESANNNNCSHCKDRRTVKRTHFNIDDNHATFISTLALIIKR